ncbi:hypothetical protein PM082_007797 [Marasmius tenuissimus]|nr:hypothetical protein PM082_007797 [Marasmius tenuissimus]
MVAISYYILPTKSSALYNTPMNSPWNLRSTLSSLRLCTQEAHDLPPTMIPLSVLLRPRRRCFSTIGSSEISDKFQ